MSAIESPICLINPPSVFLLDERVFPSLGILKVAAALKAAGRRVNFLDLSGVENYLDVAADYFAASADSAVGITVTTPQLPSAIKIAGAIRSARPALRMILGGPHVTLVYSALKMERKRGISGGRAAKAADRLEEVFDVLCSGDGELAVFEALKPNPPKLIDADDRKGQWFLSDAQFTAAPFPARELIDLSSYRYEIEGRKATSLIAQLGCPFGCGFCGGRSSDSLRVIRARGNDSIVREVEMLYREYGYTGFMFYDDELNVNKEMVPLMDRLSDLQDRLGADFRLRGFIKAELFDESQAEAMYRAGFRWLLCGFEAADPRILTNIDKRAGLDHNLRVIELARRHNLKVKALMSCGHPGESEETIRAIRDWLVENRVDEFDCTIITPYPGTAYHDMAVPHGERDGVWTYTHPKTGDRLHLYEVDYSTTANYYKGIPDGGYKAFVFTDFLASGEIVKMRDWLEEDVRATLNIPFNPERSAVRYEHSMGQGLDGFIFNSAPADGE